jgi:N-acetylmuramoyl-L-alanine amidase
MRRLFAVVLAAMFVGNQYFMLHDSCAVLEGTLFPYGNLPLEVSYTLKIPRLLKIWNPLTLCSRINFSTYCILGTSNPAKRLLFSGNKLGKIKRLKNGMFSVFVSLEPGRNVFTFRQPATEDGDLPEETSVVIYSGEDVPATEIFANEPSDESSDEPDKKDSLPNCRGWPNSQVLIRVKQLGISYTGAPDGSCVEAMISGKTVQLERDGASFRAIVDLSDVIGNKRCKSLGNITYKIVYGDESLEVKSPGSIFYAEPGVGSVVARFQLFSGILKSAPGNFDAVAIGSPKAGVVVDISPFQEPVETEFQNKYLSVLNMGQECYVSKDAVVFVAQKMPQICILSDLKFKKEEKTEKFGFTSSVGGPFCFGNWDLDAGILEFKLPGAQWEDGNRVRGVASELVKKVETVNDADGSRVRFYLTDVEAVWGYDINYPNKDKVVLSLKKKPKLGSPEKPLKEFVVVIDPGHGGSDPGASRSPGPYNEAVLNLATARVLQAYFSSLGATVLLTRNGEEDPRVRILSLDRLALMAQDVDLFISVHANSTLPSKDLSEVFGMECFFFHPQSKKIAETIYKFCSRYCGQKGRRTEEAVYTVILPTGCPAILFETGFMTNLKEYGKMCTEIWKRNFAMATCDAILSVLGYNTSGAAAVDVHEDGESVASSDSANSANESSE